MDWIFPKPTNPSCYCILNFRSYSHDHFSRCGNIYCILNFWSHSTRHVHHCGNIYFKFWSSSSSQFVLLSVFGHVQIFRSISFRHLESVMLTTLIIRVKIIISNFNINLCKTIQMIFKFYEISWRRLQLNVCIITWKCTLFHFLQSENHWLAQFWVDRNVRIWQTFAKMM